MIKKPLKEYKSKEEVVDFIKNRILDEIDLSLRNSESNEAFEKPAWSEYQAFQLGFRKALHKVLTALPDQEKSK